MKLNKFGQYSLKTLLVLLVGLSLSAKSFAQANTDTNSFAMSPIDYSANQNPGDSIPVSFQVSNNTDTAYPINLFSAEMQFSNNQPQLAVNELVTKGWINLAQDYYIIPSNSSLNISATVNVPADTTPGAYFPVILVSRVTDTANQDNTTQADINAALAFRINLNILAANQKVDPSAKASGLEVTNPVVINNLDINYAITNPTDFYIKPTAYLQIVNVKQEVVWRTVINDGGQIVNPGAVLAASTTLQLPVFGIADVGQYTAEFLVVDSQFGTTDIIKTKFNVIPLPLVVLVAGVTITLLGAIYLRTRRKRK